MDAAQLVIIPDVDSGEGLKVVIWTSQFSTNLLLSVVLSTGPEQPKTRI